MNENETISALIDDELTFDEARVAVDEMLQSPEAMDRWRRYHLIRDGLQGYRAASDRAYSEAYTKEIVALAGREEAASADDSVEIVTSLPTATSAASTGYARFRPSTRPKMASRGLEVAESGASGRRGSPWQQRSRPWLYLDFDWVIKVILARLL